MRTVDIGSSAWFPHRHRAARIPGRGHRALTGSMVPLQASTADAELPGSGRRVVGRRIATVR